MAGTTKQSRFVYHSKEEIQQKIDDSIPINTKRANNKAARSFRAFLLGRGDGDSAYDFENFDTKLLDTRLAEYWYGARTIKGQKYTSSSLENLRHGLSRYLRSPPYNKSYDIVKDPEFRESHEAFRGALRELKEEGKGSVNHHPEIAAGDLEKLQSQFKTSTPAQLQEKVQFDIRYYFFRRGAENMHKMTKSTFEVRKNPTTGERYVCQVVDELNKNHKENCKESYSGYMPERKGSKNCPVESFLLYVQHLHPKCDSLWARPKTDTSSEIWYYSRAVGIDTLGRFMKDLSVKYTLSKVYTNHSIRVTGATVLTRDNYSASQIKEVTGHKSVSSLAIYQRVSDEEKLQMGKSLSNTTMGYEQSDSNKPGPSDVQVVPLSSQERADIEALFVSAPLEVSEPVYHAQASASSSYHQESPVRSSLQPIDFQLSPYLRDMEMDPEFEFESVTSYQSSRESIRQLVHTRHLSPRPSAMFAGCTIHNLTVNVHPRS